MDGNWVTNKLTNTPCDSYVFSQVGWGMGVALYVIFGIAAAASGWMIWKAFLGLDSTRYPLQSFGDLYCKSLTLLNPQLITS